jgi:hypothetical protein
MGTGNELGLIGKCPKFLAMNYYDDIFNTTVMR